MILGPFYGDINKRFVVWGGMFLVAFVILFMPIFDELVHDWLRYNNNSHCMIVPFISCYLIYRERSKIAWDDIAACNWGLLVLISGLLLYVIGFAGNVEIFPRVAMVIVMMGFVLYNMGMFVFSVLSFPLFFLFFMVPVPISIISLVSFPLQILVTRISTYLIESLAITVLREGNMLHFVNCSMEVAEACSGIRSLTAYVMLGFLFAYLMQGSKLRRLFLPIIAIPLAFLINVVRVTGTGILANYFGSTVARGFLHEFSGLVVFGLGFILLFCVYALLDSKTETE